MTPATRHSTALYRGRFAPSPSGPLHHGSMFTALASFLDARHAGGHWLLRIEDIDPPREVPGATESILHCLGHHGLQHDSNVLYQHTRGRAYDLALEQLESQGRLFCCAVPGASCARGVVAGGGAVGMQAVRIAPSP